MLLEIKNAMYHLDYKLESCLIEPRDKLLSMYLGYLRENNVKLTKKKEEKIINSVSCFVRNASFSVSVGKSVVGITLNDSNYSAPLIYNGTKVYRKISFTETKNLFNYLIDKRYVQLTKGWKGDDDVCHPSYLTLSPFLFDLLSPYAVKKKLDVIDNVIVVKDKNKNIVEKKLTYKQKALVDMLNNLNRLLMDADITLNGEKYLLQLHKVFNENSFNKGGRTYVTGIIGSTNIMKKENRCQLQFDGENTVELDYKHLHPSIILTESGYTIEKDFDPYKISIPGYDNDILRKIAKTALLCMINSSSLQSARAALNYELFKMKVYDIGDEPVPALPYWKENGYIPNRPVETKEITKLVWERNRSLEHEFFNGAGLRLQNIDSKIMDYVLEHFIQKGELIIPIHDSIIIKESLIGEGEVVMYDAYEYVMGTKDNCIVEVKYDYYDDLPVMEID